MIFNYDFVRETEQFLAKVRRPGTWYSFCPAAKDYIQEKQIFNSDIRFALKHSEVIAASHHVVPGLMRYWVSGRDTDGDMLTMSVVIGDSPIIEIEKITSDKIK